VLKWDPRACNASCSELGAEGGAHMSNEALAASTKALPAPGRRHALLGSPACIGRLCVPLTIDARPQCEYTSSEGGAGRADATRIQREECALLPRPFGSAANAQALLLGLDNAPRHSIGERCWTGWRPQWRFASSAAAAAVVCAPAQTAVRRRAAWVACASA
jgi:hypothetical protein